MSTQPPFHSPDGLTQQQRLQFAHDRRNHSDVICLPRGDRLKHYGLHFAKYAGRIARGASEPKPYSATLVDAALVVLSAANTLNQRLDRATNLTELAEIPSAALSHLTDAAGRFADACEKIDHLEDFLELARNANLDLLAWVIAEARRTRLDLNAALEVRRAELAERAFYAS